MSAKARSRPLTLEQAREALVYDPETGIFTKARNEGCRKAGERVGWKMVNGYIGITFGSMPLYAHRIAWLFITGEWPSMKIDHINGVRSDNRACNLRLVCDRANAENIRVNHSDNKTGLLGVSRREDTGKYVAQLTTRGVRVFRKEFDTPEEAHAAYVEAKRRLHQACTI